MASVCAATVAVQATGLGRPAAVQRALRDV